MLEDSRIASASAGAAACDGERGPRRAQRRPSTDRVGVLAGRGRTEGSNGSDPSAPSWRCSPCPSSQPRRRDRCYTHPCASRPQRSLTTGCTPCVAGGCLARRWKLLSMAVKWQRAATSWKQAGARAVHPAATAGLRRGWEAHARGSDGSKLSSQLTPAAWPVRPDPPPSQGGFGASG